MDMTKLKLREDDLASPHLIKKTMMKEIQQNNNNIKIILKRDLPLHELLKDAIAWVFPYYSYYNDVIVPDIAAGKKS